MRRESRFAIRYTCNVAGIRIAYEVRTKKGDIYGLETVVSVLFSNTRTRYCTMNEKFSILHEAKLSAVLKISSSLYSKQVRVFENKTRTNSL